MPKSKVVRVIREPDGLRGLVPSREEGVKDRVYGSYLKELNPRDNKDLQYALAASPDVRFQEFLERIKRRQYNRMSLQTIAKGCNISLMEFTNWWNKTSTQAAIAHAQVESVNITKDMVSDARSREGACERCDGLTWIAAPEGMPTETPGYRPLRDATGTKWIRDCPNCNSGRVTKPGDAHARDRVLEMAGLVRKGGGVNVNVNQFAGADHASAVSNLSDAMTIDID